MFWYRPSIGRKIVRHTLLITMLIAVSSIAVTYLYVLSFQYIQASKEVQGIHSKNEEIVRTFTRTSAQEMQRIMEQITPFIVDGTIPATDTIAAIEYRAQVANPLLKNITIYNSDRILYGSPIVQNTFNYQPVQLQFSSDGIVQDILYYKEISTGVFLVFRYDLYTLLSNIGANTTEHVEAYVQVPLSAGTAQAFFIHSEPNGQSVNVTNTSSIPSGTQTTFIHVILRQTPHIFTANVSVDTWSMVTSINRTNIEMLPVSIARYLLILTVIFCALACILARILAGTIVEPISWIKQKLLAYKPAVADYKPTIHTKDELESLDASISSIAADLSKAYNGLETAVIHQHSVIEKMTHRDSALFNSVSIGIIIVDERGHIVEMNTAMKNMLHIDITNERNMPIQTFIPIQCKNHLLDTAEHPVIKALLTKEEIRILPDEHYALQTLDRSWVQVRMIITPIVEKNTVQGAIIIVQNANEEYEVETLKSDFIGLVSHQLRTPLSSIQWYSELLSSEENSNFTMEQRSFVVELRLASQKLSNIITEMLDANRLHDNTINPQIETFNCIALLNGIIRDAIPVAKRTNITINMLYSLAELQIVSDPILLGIVLQNVIANAVRYSHENGTVRVRLEQNKNVVICHVSDDGIGIPQSDQSKIFQKLYRSKNALQKNVDGSGLGLYSSKKIMKILGGHIHFASIEGRGSTFSITIPLDTTKNSVQ